MTFLFSEFTKEDFTGNKIVKEGVLEQKEIFFGHTHGMRDLNSPTRDRTRAPCSGSAES